MSRNKKTFVSRLDSITILLYLLLVAIGLLAIFSVEYRSTDSSWLMSGKSHTRQLMFLGISFFVGILIMFTDSKFFSSVAYLSYTIGLFLLLITIFAGTSVKGSSSWLGVGAFRFQPGEMCKIFTSLALAKFLSSSETNFRTFTHRLVGAGFALVPAILIILQKETGLALVYFSFFLVMYREGLPHGILIAAFSGIALTIITLTVDKTLLLYLLTGAAILIGVLIRKTLSREVMARVILIGAWAIAILFSQFAVPFLFKNVLQKHQVERIYTTIGQEVPEAYLDPEDIGKRRSINVSGYNVWQSKIAIGSGGFAGKGFLNGTSTKNEFVPEQNTDFIFCAIGEQFGFLGSTALVLIYLALMMRILFIAEKQRSAFSRIYGYCVASILFFHFAINISMTIGLAPVIGITLPLLSYGGTSLLSFSILIFILLRLDADRHVMIR